MRSKQFFSSLIFLLGFSSQTLGADPKEFNAQLLNLEKAIKEESSFETRYEKFRQIRKKIKAAKEKKPRTEESLEISMRLFLDSLSSFPDKAINKSQCKDMEKESEQMNRVHSEDAEDPYLARSRKILASLCK